MLFTNFFTGHFFFSLHHICFLLDQYLYFYCIVHTFVYLMSCPTIILLQIFFHTLIISLLFLSFVHLSLFRLFYLIFSFSHAFFAFTNIFYFSVSLLYINFRFLFIFSFLSSILSSLFVRNSVSDFSFSYAFSFPWFYLKTTFLLAIKDTWIFW